MGISKIVTIRFSNYIKQVDYLERSIVYLEIDFLRT
jgi:hypothetical protein